jgi:hypothetical protein
MSLENLDFKELQKGVKRKDRWPLKRGSVEMKFSMTGQEKGDLSLQVTA